MKHFVCVLASFTSLIILSISIQADPVGNVIFIHPDGTGLGHWNAARHLYNGPDGMLNWDRMERLAAYRPHQANWLSTTSHAGATVHAYGKKVHHNSFGIDRDQPITALSGKKMTIMEEAMNSGIRVGLVNTGNIGEPGTAVFLSRSGTRNAVGDIGAQVLSSGADLIFSGGEKYLIPKGIIGHHGVEGVREDERDLLSECRARGYTVIFTRDELLSLPQSTRKVIGIFAANNTYNVATEEVLKEQGLPTYDPEAPTFAEMVDVAIRVLSSDRDNTFLLVAEEEGTDNFSNKMNASGMLDAIGRADQAIGVAMRFIEEQPTRPTMLLVAGDSDAAHPGVWAPKEWDSDYKLKKQTRSGSELDGPNGAGGEPFWSKPDRFGIQHPFGIAWGHAADMPGSAVTKAHGSHSELLSSTVDNTDIYKIIFQVIFGKFPRPTED